MRWLSFLLLGLTLWALVDAARRRVEPYWYFLLVLGFPFAAIAYFIWVKVKAPGAGASTNTNLSPMEQLLEQADRLESRGAYSMAERAYRQVLDMNAANARALHGAARCLAELNELQASLDHFERLMVEEPRFRDYTAALEYAEVLARSQRVSDAVDLLRGLSNESPRPNHRLAFAYYLSENNQEAEARLVLTELLEELEAAGPEGRAGQWQTKARALLDGISLH